MKKKLLLLVLLMLPLMASAAVEVDGIYYTVNNNAFTVAVTKNPNKYSGTVVIPTTVNIDDATYRVTGIGSYAFYGCMDLTDVVIPDGITDIGDHAFSDCTGLTTIVVPTSVTSIGRFAFVRCSKLASVTLPDAITSIDALFSDCSSLSSLTIPSGVTSISGDTFFHCTSLSSIVIPNGVTSIGEGAFTLCTMLSTVTLGKGIRELAKQAFSECSRLNTVYCFADQVPTTDEEAFRKSQMSVREYLAKATLYVPIASLEAYKTTAPWSYFGTIEGLDQETAIEMMTADDTAIESAFTLEGRQADSSNKGIIIVRMSNGQLRKVIRR